MRQTLTVMTMAIAVAAIGVMADPIPLLAQTPSSPTVSAPTPAPPQKDYRPGLGDLMLLVVQPRHLKLGLAGRDGNWPLAAFSLSELKAALTKAGLHQPRWRNGFPIPETTNALMSAPVEALDSAIKAHDAAAFAKAYADLTAGCNACHAAANIGFIRIKTPADAVGFPNQDFLPAK